MNSISGMCQITSDLFDAHASRFAIFYSINIFANGFGSILAYGIMQLHGKNGYMGWRWYYTSKLAHLFCIR